MDDSIDLADIGQELISQSLALGSPFYQTGDIYKLDYCMSGFF